MAEKAKDDDLAIPLGVEESETEPPQVPEYDQLSHEQRQALQATFGMFETVLRADDDEEDRSAAAGSDVVDGVAVVQVPNIADVAGRRLRAPANFRQLASRSLNSGEVGAQLLSLSREFARDRNGTIEVRNLADSFFRSRGRLTYAGFVRRLEELFHRSYDWRALLMVQYFVGQVMKLVARSGRADSVELCETIANYFVSYLTHDLLSILVRMLRHRVEQVRDHWQHFGIFAAGFSVGCIFTLTVVAARNQRS